ISHAKFTVYDNRGRLCETFHLPRNSTKRIMPRSPRRLWGRAGKIRRCEMSYRVIAALLLGLSIVFAGASLVQGQSEKDPQVKEADTDAPKDDKKEGAEKDE